MMARLEEREHSCTYEAVLAKHETHFVLPEGMMRILAPKWLIDFFVAYAFKEAKGYKNDYRKTRQQIDAVITKAIKEW